MLLHFVRPFNFVIMQHDHVLKKLTFDLLIPSTRSEQGGGGVCSQNICYHVAAFRDTILFDMQLGHILKKLNLDLVTPRVGQNSSYHCAAFVIPLYL